MSASATRHPAPGAHQAAATPNDRRAAGKHLRSAASRKAHGAWRARAGGADPLSILRAADAMVWATLLTAQLATTGCSGLMQPPTAQSIAGPQLLGTAPSPRILSPAWGAAPALVPC